MLSERMLTGIVKNITKSHLVIDPTTEKFLPGPEPGRKYMLYLSARCCAPTAASTATPSARQPRDRTSRIFVAK